MSFCLYWGNQNTEKSVGEISGSKTKQKQNKKKQIHFWEQYFLEVLQEESRVK